VVSKIRSGFRRGSQFAPAGWILGSLGALLLLGGLLRRSAPTVAPSPPVGPIPGERPEETRYRVVRIALGELEQRDPEKYWTAVTGPASHPKTSWCAAFALWVLRVAGLVNWLYDQAGAWFYKLPLTEDPKPGDLAFFVKTRHLALVAATTEQTISFIDGAGTGGRVSSRTVDRDRLPEVEYHSIAPLLEPSVGEEARDRARHAWDDWTDEDIRNELAAWRL
jgi:hypothetical protein